MSESSKTLYLHIGIGKTGTTALQEFWASNADQLVSLGVKYASTGFDQGAHHILGHYWGVGWMQKQAVDQEISSGGDHWLKLSEEFRSSSDHLLVSTESLARAFSERPESLVDIKTKLAGVNIKFLIYLRRQDLHVESWYNQLIKTGLSSDHFRPFEQTPSFYDYYALLTSISTVFGHSSVIVRAYEKNQFFGKSIYQDASKALGLGWHEGFEIPKRDPNPRIDLKTLEFLRQANESDLNWQHKYEFNNKVIHSVAAYQAGSCDDVLMDLNERKAFLARYEQSNRMVAIEFMSREDGQLFYDALESEGAKQSTEDYELSVANAVEVTLAIWQQMNRENYLLRQQLSENSRYSLTPLLRKIKKLFVSNQEGAGD